MVYQYDLQGNFIKCWDCVSDAQRDLKINHISEVCNGTRKKCGGYVWRYKND
jgi:hypothetical protein